MKIVDIKQVKQALYQDLIQKIKHKYSLAIIYNINDQISKKYIDLKTQQAQKLGIEVLLYPIDNHTSLESIQTLIQQLNHDAKVSGILIQMPINPNLDQDAILNSVDITKDVDGLSIYNIYPSKNYILPATAKGILSLIKYLNYDLTGKNVALVGRGKLVNRPLINQLIDLNATVTIFHSHSQDLINQLKNYQVIISAVGKKRFLKLDDHHNLELAIDAGTTIEDSKVYGDLDLESLANSNAIITKVPGGVGALTIVSLLDNLVLLAEKYQNYQ